MRSAARGGPAAPTVSPDTDDDVQVPPVSVCSRQVDAVAPQVLEPAARSASSIDSIVSRIVAPWNAQISGCVSSCSHSNAPARELVVRAAVPPVLVRVRAVVLRVEERRLHHVDRARRSAPACTRDRGCARRRPRSKRSSRSTCGRRRGARPGGRARAAARSRARPRSTRGCRRPSASSGTTSTTRPRPPRPRPSRARRRARGRRRGAGSGRPAAARGRSRPSGSRRAFAACSSSR